MWFTGLQMNDLFVGNLQRSLSALIERLGCQPPDFGLELPGVAAGGVFSPAGFGADTTFTRLSPWSQDLLQLISMRPLASWEMRIAPSIPMNSLFGILPGMLTWQGERPMKTHRLTTQLADERLLELVAFWDRNDVPYVVTAPCDAVPFPAVFPGWSGDPIAFSSEHVVTPWEWGSPALFEFYNAPDKEHWLEALAAASAGHAALPEPEFPSEPAPAGTLHKVLARSFLVDNLESSLEVLRLKMDLAPESNELHEEIFDNFKFARISGGDGAIGAAIELIEPLSESGRVADFYDGWGAGAFAIRLGTDSLDACRGALEQRGTRWSTVDAETGVDRILVDSTQLYGVLIEIEEIS